MTLRRAGVVLAGTFALGLPYWFLPYNHVPSWPVIGFTGMLAGAIGAAALRGFVQPTACVSLGFVVACMARVVVDLIKDPTTHNLLPFEVVMAAVAGLISGAAGVLVARLAQRQLAGTPGKPFQ
jgi:H+/Cl- antiporter ClcA